MLLYPANLVGLAQGYWHLLISIINQARLEKIDFVGTSFAATPDVLAFWKNSGFIPVRLGTSRDACSGCYSAVLLVALNPAAAVFLDAVSSRFNVQFSRNLAIQYPQLEPELVLALLSTCNSANSLGLDQQDWLDIEAFALGFRQYDHCYLALWKLTCIALSEAESQQQLSAYQIQLLIVRILQNQSLDVTAGSLSFTGKKEINSALRETIKIVFNRQLSILKV